MITNRTALWLLLRLQDWHKLLATRSALHLLHAPVCPAAPLHALSVHPSDRLPRPLLFLCHATCVYPHRVPCRAAPVCVNTHPQVGNAFVSRRIGLELNFFKGLLTSPIFLTIMVLITAMQVLIMQTPISYIFKVRTPNKPLLTGTVPCVL